jgi:2',3'-cyclic-nucleotide 2'-phosphodiesterase (5'-nucleotidase family)
MLAALSVPVLVLVLLLTGAHRAPAQQPAPKTGAVPTQSPVPQTAIQPAPGTDVRARVTETAVDASIPNDPPVDKMLAVYSPKVRELDVVIGKLKGELRKGGTGAGSLGNFVTDGMRAQAAVKTGKEINLALMNAGGMRRSTIGEGELRARDIFELLPFENALVTIDLTGEQLLRLMKTIVAKREAQSGARLVYKTNADKTNELVSAKVRDSHAPGEKDIDPNAIYTIVTIDYLYRVGGSTYGMLQEGKNMKELGITLRDALMGYVKAETAAGRDIKPNLDGRFVFDRAGSALPEEVRPQ